MTSGNDHAPARRRVAIVAAAWLGLTGTGERPSIDTVMPARFDAVAFFSGRTEGTGRLKIMMRPAHAVHVHGSGTTGADGRLTLTQRVEEDGKSATLRRWVIVPDGPDRYTGTLTGTTAPIRGVVTGNQLHLWLKLRGGLTAQQWLVLQPGGRTALNRMRVFKLGLPVATLRETIRKVD